MARGGLRGMASASERDSLLSYRPTSFVPVAPGALPSFFGSSLRSQERSVVIPSSLSHHFVVNCLTQRFDIERNAAVEEGRLNGTPCEGYWLAAVREAVNDSGGSRANDVKERGQMLLPSLQSYRLAIDTSGFQADRVAHLQASAQRV